MPNNIAVSITADVADLTAKRAIASAELKVLQKDLNDLARSAQTGGLTDALKTQLLAAGDAAAKASNQVKLISNELKAFTPAAAGAHAGSAGVTRELIVMAREASRGNFSRLAGSATILAGRLNVLTPTVLLTGAAIAALAAPIAIFLIAAEKGSEELAKFKNAMAATNGYAGVTFSQLQEMAQGMAQWANEGVGTATAELMKLAASGKFTGQTLALVGDDATRMAQLTGQSADQFNAEFEKMGDGVAKFAADYQAKYAQLTTAQYAYIRELEQQGRTEEAEYQVAKDIHDYLGTKAPEQLGVLEGAWRKVTNALSAYVDELKAIGRDTPQDRINAAQRDITELQRPKWDAGGPEYEGQLADAKARLAAAEAAKTAEEKTAAAAAAAAVKQKEGVAAAADLATKFEASKTSGEKLAAAIAKINDETAKAKAAGPGNAALYDKEAAAAISQARKSDGPPKGPKGPKADKDEVAIWQAQLQTQLEDEKNYFGDSKAEELKFWTEKLAQTKAGSEQQRQVKTKIYDLDKELARQSYEVQVATLNDQLEADRDNWAKEQADWQAKLAYIRSVQGEESTAYQEANKGFEAAERQHRQVMAEIARAAETESLEELKASLETQRTIREANAKTQESQINEKAKYTPGGDIQAATQTMALHKQLAAQQMADDQQVYAQEDALRQAAISRAQGSYGQDSAQYAQAVEAKKKADADFYNQQRVLQNQATQQQIADFQRIQQAWHGYVDPMVATTGTQIKGLLLGTESWGTAIKSIGDQALNLVIQSIERMAEQWIISMITGQAAQKTTAVSQIASYAGVAGAAGVASYAAAPFPLDLAAPAFGASMSAAALAFGSLGGFAKGLDVVPDDMIAQIHKGERIMPAADNSQLMAALAGANQSGGGRNGTGDRGGKTLSDIHREILKQTSASMGTAAASRNLHSLGKRALKGFRK